MLAAFVIACNWSRILHEFGHVTAALATGGRAGEVRVSPVSWSYAYCQSPSPRIVRWGGFALQTVGGVVVLGLAWLLAKRWSLIGILFALLALNGAGSYMIAGVLTGVGDAGGLAALGVPPTVLWALGAGLVGLSIPLGIPLAATLGVGRGRCGPARTMLAFSPGVFYLVLTIAWNALTGQGMFIAWLLTAGLQVASLFLATGLACVVAVRLPGRDWPEGSPSVWAISLAAAVLLAAMAIWL